MLCRIMRVRLKMVHLQATCPNIPRGIGRETSCRYTSWNTVRMSEKRFLERDRGFMYHFCTSSSSSASQTEEAGNIGLDGNYGERKEQSGYLVREYGWKVRRMVEEESEMRKVAEIQAVAFHEPVILFNDLFLQFFQAEVLSALIYRLRNSPPDRYACLVAKPNTDVSKELVGIVDVTVLRDKDVLQHLPGAQEYLYVSGIAVAKNFRRKKVATALLKACDMVSIRWGYEYLVLRAYEDDLGALKLYGNAGYRVVSRDSPWMTTWVGRKRRVLMIKCPHDSFSK